MVKTRIYIEPEDINDTVEVKDKATVHKIKDVLRLKKEDFIYVFDGIGGEYLYRIDKIERSVFILEKERYDKRKSSPKNKIILGFPLIKEEKIDFILQKATELGVMGFLPFVCQRSLKMKPPVSRIMRWRKIVIEAVRQSGRLWIPQIRAVDSLDKVVQKKHRLKIALSISGGNPGKILDKKAGEILIVAGPEGDFTPLEYEKLKVSGFKFVKLSSHILRSETAAVFGTGLVRYLMDRLACSG